MVRVVLSGGAGVMRVVLSGPGRARGRGVVASAGDDEADRGVRVAGRVARPRRVRGRARWLPAGRALLVPQLPDGHVHVAAAAAGEHDRGAVVAQLTGALDVADLAAPAVRAAGSPAA